MIILIIYFCFSDCERRRRQLNHTLHPKINLIFKFEQSPIVSKIYILFARHKKKLHFYSILGKIIIIL